jgi:hypothetical protein
VRRPLILLFAFCLVLATAGCGGNEDNDGDTDATDKATEGESTLDPKDEKEPVFTTAKCTAQVKTAGALEAEWGGDATVRTVEESVGSAGPDAVYVLNDERTRVALYSAGPEFKGSISVIADGLTYSSDPADAESFDIDPHGRYADVAATLISTSGDKLKLVAEFTCGETKE